MRNQKVEDKKYRSRKDELSYFLSQRIKDLES